MHARLAALVTAALCAALLPSPAAAQHIMLPGTQPGGLTTPLLPAAQCTECHGGNVATDGHPYMPSDLWPASMMANATRDPLFRATLVVAEQDRPGVAQYCLRCHTPTAFTAGRANAGDLARLDPLEGDLDGVSCDACHRSIDARMRDPMAPYAGNARLFFEDAPAGMAPRRHGPRNDPFMSPRHPSVGDPFISDSRMCGQCHDVDNPVARRRMPNGTETSDPFPLQSTFTEWSQSAFARRTSGPNRTCQDCHMPAETEPLVASRLPGAPMREGIRRHEFVGANEWGMAMLRAAYPGELDEQYDALRARNRTFLQGAARLEAVDPPREARVGASVPLAVRVTNLTGHKLPTGYEDARLMWLQVEVNGRVVSGAYENDALVEDAQLRAYRFLPGHFEGGRAVLSDFVARHDVVMEDTRIPPEGMMPNARTMPVGRDYAGGPGGALRHFDEARFELPAPTTPGPLTVRVRLMYQSTTKHYVEAIAAANRTNNEGRRLLEVWNASGRAAPFAMAQLELNVDVRPGGAAGDGGASGDAGVAGDGGGTMMVPGGCGCRAAGGNGARGNAWLVLLSAAAVAATSARRRRRRPAR